MIFNKNRLALLAGIDNRDQYFGKTLRENTAIYEDEGAEEVPLDVEDEEAGEEVDLEAEAGDEEAVPKEEIADALAPLLGVDAEELSALVSGGEEVADEEGDEEVADEEGDEEIALESDVIVVDASEEGIEYSGSRHDHDEELSGPAAVAERRLRKAIRKEIASVLKETRTKRSNSDIRRARKTKSLAAVMGFDRKR